MGVARDTYPHDGATLSFVASFAEVEVDVETGAYRILDFLCVADVGTVVHPAALGGQVLGRSILGIGHAIGQRWVYDQRYGVALARRFYSNKPPTILDVPAHMDWAAVELPDPETPVGARGIGEPPVVGRLLRRAERDFRRGGRRSVRARAGDARPHPDRVGNGQAHAGPIDGERLSAARLGRFVCVALLAASACTRTAPPPSEGGHGLAPARHVVGSRQRANRVVHERHRVPAHHVGDERRNQGGRRTVSAGGS